MVAPPSLKVEEYQYGDTGVLLNGDTALPFFDITSVQGLSNAPVRLTTVDRERYDGSYVDARFESARTVTIEGTIYADVSNMERYLDQLKGNFGPDDVVKPLYFRTDAELRVVYGKALGITYSKEQLRRLGCANAQIQIICEDPRIYSIYDQSIQIAAGATGSLRMDGNRPTPGSIRIDGPTSGAALTSPAFSRKNPATGLYDLKITVGISLAVGEYLTFYLDTKEVVWHTAGIDVDARSATSFSLGTLWFWLSPGINDFKFDGATSGAPGPGSKMTVTGRPAWR